MDKFAINITGDLFNLMNSKEGLFFKLSINSLITNFIQRETG